MDARCRKHRRGLVLGALRCILYIILLWYLIARYVRFFLDIGVGVFGFILLSFCVNIFCFFCVGFCYIVVEEVLL